MSINAFSSYLFFEITFIVNISEGQNEEYTGFVPPVPVDLTSVDKRCPSSFISEEKGEFHARSTT